MGWRREISLFHRVVIVSCALAGSFKMKLKADFRDRLTLKKLRVFVGFRPQMKEEVITSRAIMVVIVMNDPSVIFPTKLSARQP